MFLPPPPPPSLANGHSLSSMLTRRFPAEHVAHTNAEIARLLVGSSHFVRGINFTVIAPADLSRMFDLYDAAYFDGHLRQSVNEKAGGRLGFRLAPRMTRAGGKTFRVRRPVRRGLTKSTETSYEIAISSRLLFLSFDDASRPATVCGVPCVDRLSALQRIMEHEMLHLAEMLVWDRSSCTAARFKSMSRNLFGHAASTHELVTPAERAVAKFDLRIGDAVTFTFDGRTLRGMLNRINRRATVLVETPTGQPYTNGCRYEKFYIPLGMLKKEG
jgi:hypothetical protein